MNIDSGMAEGVLLSLIKRGSVAMPLHDGFMVEDSRRGDILEAMATQLHRVLGQDVSHCESVTFPSPVLHMVPPALGAPALATLAGFPVVVVVLPSSDRQGELFGASSPVGVPADDVFGWRGGLAPETVRKALRREIRRRGLHHAQAAEHVGLSRPQLVNILQGRFGASPPVAQRIRQFLLEEAVTVKAG
jgi:hypothetical protein